MAVPEPRYCITDDQKIPVLDCADPLTAAILGPEISVPEPLFAFLCRATDQRLAVPSICQRSFSGHELSAAPPTPRAPPFTPRTLILSVRFLITVLQKKIRFKSQNPRCAARDLVTS